MVAIFSPTHLQLGHLMFLHGNRVSLLIRRFEEWEGELRNNDLRKPNVTTFVTSASHSLPQIYSCISFKGNLFLLKVCLGWAIARRRWCWCWYRRGMRACQSPGCLMVDSGDVETQTPSPLSTPWNSLEKQSLLQYKILLWMGRPGALWLGVIMTDSQRIKSVLASPVSVK